MANMSEIIARNILEEMRKISKKQIELATDINVSKQTMSKMLSGDRMITASELAAIAKVLNVSTDILVRLPKPAFEVNTVKALMGKVNTDAAREGLEIIDKLADMACFYTKCVENGKAMSNISWGNIG